MKPVNLAPPKPEPKLTVALRLDRELVEWFKSHSPQYQVAIREVLRAYVRDQDAK